MSQQPHKRNSDSLRDGSAADALASSNFAPAAADAESVESKPDAARDESVLSDPVSSSSAVLPSSSEHIASSPMLRLLGRDAGAQSVLFRLLDWCDCAALHCTGRSLRSWLDRAPVTPASSVIARLADFESMARCRWLPQFLTSMEVADDEDDEEESTDEEQTGDSDSSEKQLQRRSLRESMFNQFLDNVHCFGRLQLLHVSVGPTICAVSAGSAHRAFAALPKLEQLIIETQSARSDAVIHGLLAHVHLLPSLRGLEIIGEIGSTQALDFGPLALCPQLDCLRVASESPENEDVPLSSAQFGAIAECKAITDLEVGSMSWLAPYIQEVKHDDAVETKWIDEHVGFFLTAKHNAVAASSGVAPLKHLALRDTAMSPLLWDLLVQHSQIEELDANSWFMGMSAAQWSQLPLFTGLRRLAIHPHPSETRSASDFHSLLRVDDFLAPLLQCATLTSLTLGGGLEVTRSALESIVSALTLLTSLELTYAYLETLEPLRQCAQLESLTLSANTDLAYHYLQYRPLIPSLPHLTALRIDERPVDRLSAVDVAPLNVALLARCPLLTMQNFRQTLLDEGGDASEEGEEA